MAHHNTFRSPTSINNNQSLTTQCFTCKPPGSCDYEKKIWCYCWLKVTCWSPSTNRNSLSKAACSSSGSTSGLVSSLWRQEWLLCRNFQLEWFRRYNRALYQGLVTRMEEHKFKNRYELHKSDKNIDLIKNSMYKKHFLRHQLIHIKHKLCIYVYLKCTVSVFLASYLNRVYLCLIN